jgi:hypothetical protein
VRQVEQVLIVGVGMDRRHPSFPDPELLVNDFRQRGEAVGRARRVRDDLVLRGIVHLVVDAQHERNVGALGGRRDDDLLRAGGDVLRGGGAIGEEAGRLEDDVDAKRPPAQFGRVSLREDLELVALHRDAAVLRLDARLQVADHRVVFEQVREGIRARQIVDGDEIDVLVAQRRPHDVPPDAPESVDPDPYSHRCPPDKRFILQ